MEPLNMRCERGISHTIIPDSDLLTELDYPFLTVVSTPDGFGTVMGLENNTLYILLDKNASSQVVTPYKLSATNEIPPCIAKKTDNEDRKLYHRVKELQHKNITVRIITQNKNGPCPIIALANALILQKKITLDKTSDCISFHDFKMLVADYAKISDELPKYKTQKSIYKQHNGKECPTLAGFCSQSMIDARHTLLEGQVWNEEKMLEYLDNLYKGLDVNLIFSDVESFTYEPCIGLFAICGVRLLHGWVIDEADPFARFRDLCFNELTEIISYSPRKNEVASDPENPSKEKIEDDNSAGESAAKPNEAFDASDIFNKATPEERELAAIFYAETMPTQLTRSGLEKLRESLDEGEVAVLFWRNHFFTVVKHERMLLTLCTDENFVDKPSFVFNILDDSLDNVEFLNGNFDVIDPAVSYIQAIHGEEFSERQILRAKRTLEAKGVNSDDVEPETVLRYLLKKSASESLEEQYFVSEMEEFEKKVKSFLEVFPECDSKVARRLLRQNHGGLTAAIQEYLNLNN